VISSDYLSRLSKTVKGSLLDLPKNQLEPNIWIAEEDELPTLRPDLKHLIVRSWEHGVRSVLGTSASPWVKRVIFLGGSASYQWRTESDIDVNIAVNFDSFRRLYPRFTDDDMAQKFLIQIAIKINKSGVFWLHHPINYYIQEPGVAKPVTDAAYDVLEDCWMIPPLVLPEDFDPKVYFKPYLQVAQSWMDKFDATIMDLRRATIDFKKNVEQRQDPYLAQDRELLETRYKDICDEVTLHLRRLLMWFEDLRDRRNELYERLRQQEDYKPYARFQEPEVVYKYLEKYGYLDFLKALKGVFPEELPDCLSHPQIELVDSLARQTL